MINKIKSLIYGYKKYTGKVQTHPYKNIRQYTMAKMSELASAYSTLKTTKADAVLGTVPLYGVYDYEVSRTTDHVSFRAAKGQFFRQQEGAEVALVINMTLVGPLQDVMLTLMEYTFLDSKRHREREAMVRNRVTVDKGSVKTPYTPETVSEMGETGLEMPERRWFNTFTFVTTIDVLFDIYIENYVYQRSVRNGQNVIMVSLFCKKFFPPEVFYVERHYDYTSEELGFTFNVRDYAMHSGLQPVEYQGVEYAGRDNIMLNSPRRSYNDYEDIQTVTAQNRQMSYRLIKTKRFRPKYADWADLALRSAFRLIETRNRYLRIKTRGYVPLGWSLQLDDMENFTPKNIRRVINAGYTKIG